MSHIKLSVLLHCFNLIRQFNNELYAVGQRAKCGTRLKMRQTVLWSEYSLIYCQFEEMKTIAILLWHTALLWLQNNAIHHTIEFANFIRNFEHSPFTGGPSSCLPNENCRDNYIEHVMCKNKTNQLSMIDEACRFIRGIPKVVCHFTVICGYTDEYNNKHHI